MIVLQQERDFSDKINAIFSFVSQNFKTLFLSVSYFAGPLSLMSGIANGIIKTNRLDFASLDKTTPSGTSSADIFSHSFESSISQLFTLNHLIAFTFIILASATVAITVYALIIEYRENPKLLTIHRIWARMQTIFLPVLSSYSISLLILMLILISFAATIAALISSGGGFFAGFLSITIGLVGLFLITFFFVVYSLCPAIVAYESINVWEALGRAMFLIKNKWWSTFGLIVIISIINSFVAMIFEVPTMIVTFMKLLKLGDGIAENVPLIITTVISTVGQVIVSSLTYVAISFQYFNLVEKREGTGLKTLIESIGQKKLDFNEDEEY